MLNAAEETTNNADFDLEITATDADTRELIDFTGAEIVLSLKDKNGCERLRATTDDGSVVIVGVGVIAITFPPERMKRIEPATYKIGAVCQLNGKTFPIFIGSVTVVDGVAFI